MNRRPALLTKESEIKSTSGKSLARPKHTLKQAAVIKKIKASGSLPVLLTRDEKRKDGKMKAILRELLSETRLPDDKT